MKGAGFGVMVLIVIGAWILAAQAPPVSTMPAAPVFSGEAPPAASSPIASSPTARDRPAGIAGGVDSAWLASTAVSTGIPARALAAYAGAQLRLIDEQPDCGIGWNTLAGIGKIESGHGSHGGASVATDGQVAPEIRGIQLDGSASARINDSDGGALDGDSEWDRAVGPMQFIPDTWKRWGADGNGDTVADPHQIDDAALTAARYLCAAGDLLQPDTWRTAILSYNHSEEYVANVADAANGYADRVR
ncbi:lytic transglycosylase domain-containing protein [Diaminobutyricimonas sp. TR449]|uniref:lytic transglycosylase domain-containing protein n=1 Tax=Diaminobutyricimonas sp. TR449 TaxID=2708076 RepID=UPI001FBAB56B|nr:lytic transglycosylase domain-containing protein [Diaminobutyricimonas sp. TR449]